ncbi:MAG: pyridoxal phosphate-dependent aminotransferase [Candidatus Eremiobacterota bacterium]
MLETPGFRSVPRTGVIYVMSRAASLGFSYQNPEWANLGQGSPETGPLPGAPPRVDRLAVSPAQQSYSPIEGYLPLRRKVAQFYNALYRRGKASQYTADNVSIAGGGRLALTRIAAALDSVNMGYFIPDYTAYEELLSGFKNFVPIPILLESASGYKISQGDLRREVLGRGLAAVLISNPTNPTGQLAEGNELKAWVRLARECRCSFILDEFYSHFIYTGSSPSEGKTVSAAAYLEDVDEDPVILVDGLTKNWRYPGWRISWTLGPRPVIEAIASAGSFLDGGANHPFQQEAVALLDPEAAHAETVALQTCFWEKRALMLERLKRLGIEPDADPEGAFYVWANLSRLPAPLNDGLAFFEAGLKEKVITVPGVFFDVNPGKRRPNARYDHYCRISFGPERPVLERGLDALERVILKTNR